MAINVEEVRRDFPQLTMKVGPYPLVYLDSAATTLKPQEVSDRVACALKESANVHRGAHYMSDRATRDYEDSRKSVAQFISAPSEEEVVFTKGTTESINLVASSLGETLSEGDEILITEMEHHSNIIPWQLLCMRKGLHLKVAPIEDKGSLNMGKFRSLLTERTRVASFVYVSNTLGMKNPVEQLVEMARRNKTLTLVDAAQAMGCLKVDVQSLGCDFLAFSAHKVFGPFGLGVLWGRQEILNSLPPYQGGGSMISTVSFDGSRYLDSPHRFEAGTPNISGAIGFKSALDYFSQWDWASVYNHESSLIQRANEGLRKIGDVRFIGDPDQQINLTSFLIGDLHPGDVGHILDQQGVAVRTGHHCTQPLMKRFGITGTLRASFSIYNNEEDVDIFLGAVKKAKELLS